MDLKDIKWLKPDVLPVFILGLLTAVCVLGIMVVLWSRAYKQRKKKQRKETDRNRARQANLELVQHQTRASAAVVDTAAVVGPSAESVTFSDAQESSEPDSDQESVTSTPGYTSGAEFLSCGEVSDESDSGTDLSVLIVDQMESILGCMIREAGSSRFKAMEQAKNQYSSDLGVQDKILRTIAFLAKAHGYRMQSAPTDQYIALLYQMSQTINGMIRCAELQPHEVVREAKTQIKDAHLYFNEELIYYLESTRSPDLKSVDTKSINTSSILSDQTPLMKMCGARSKVVQVLALLVAKADPNQQSWYHKNTALHTTFASPVLAATLMNHNADARIQNQKGETPFDTACANQCGDTFLSAFKLKETNKSQSGLSLD